MAIRRSAAAETQDLVDALTSADAVVRETAAARLSAIGPRVVPHLLAAFERTSSAVARVAILRILEATRDRRGLDLGLRIVTDPGREPSVSAAAVSLLGAFVDDEQTRALEALGALAVDQDRPDLERLAAWQMLERMPEHILAPLRKRLAKDRSAALRRKVAASREPSAGRLGTIDPGELLESAAGGEPTEPSVLGEAAAAAGAAVPLTVLHRLVERCKQQQDGAPAEADRLEWLRARGALHAALARRGSRVALYDVKDVLSSASGAVTEDFVAAAALVGDAECLEAVADALARAPATLEAQEQQWRDRLVQAGRAIAQRERLTRRHAAVRRLSRKHPDITGVLLG